jgi:threonine dehydrogenase-like Zn-dependent dehydrogenase
MPMTHVRELTFVRSGRLAWHERPAPRLTEPGDAIVRPFIAGRCDGDTLPLHRPVSRAMQAGLALGLIDPVVRGICGPVPFRGPFAIGHECVAEVIETGPGVTGVRLGQRVIVPWSISCGTCPPCLRGLTSKCDTTTRHAGPTLAAFGFGPACGPWGGMITDTLRIPHADHMLVPIPHGIPALRVAAASDNLADAWRAVIPPLTARGGGRVLILGGGARSIGLYAAGLAAAHGAVVAKLDHTPTPPRFAQTHGPPTPPTHEWP